MLCCQSVPPNDLHASRSIDLLILEERRNSEPKLKLLLLGTRVRPRPRLRHFHRCRALVRDAVAICTRCKACALGARATHFGTADVVG